MSYKGPVAAVEGLELDPKGKVEPLRGMSVSCISKPVLSQILECMLR